jgi:nucleoside-diphosphate-sugar epimerase
MRVFVAGATGVIGRPLIARLLDAGHEVVGTTRSQARVETIRALGAEPVVVDARDTDALQAAVVEARPDVVINELTRLPDRLNYRKPKETFAATNELRGKVGPALAGAAAQAGAGRLISQSICFAYASTGKPAHDEDDPLAEGRIALEMLEHATLETPGLDGVVLRYGYFYGPGTFFARGGSTWADVRRRRFPLVGRATGVLSFAHVEDAATATLAALDRGSPGTYNVCDDDPAPMSEWLPAYAEAIGAKPPLRVPTWLARLFAGQQGVQLATTLEGASNEKAKRELGWEPQYPSWRQGFREGLQ